MGATAQFTAIDYAAAEQAITALATNPDLRARMGAAAKARAREVFDWAAVIPQYQALWAEQNARRLAAQPLAGDRDNPYRPDPYTLFQSYPTHHLTASVQVALSPGMDWSLAEVLLKNPLVAYSAFNRPTLEEVQQVLAFLAERSSAAVREVVELMPPARRPFVERGLLWLGRYGVVTLSPGGG